MPAPITDSVIFAMARLVDDAQSYTREPSHSDLEFQINRARLTLGDPKAQGQLVGKAKRIRGTLSWALENNPAGGEALVESLLSFLRASGGFRATSTNFVGAEPIANAIAAFQAEGFTLTADGELRPQLLENLSGMQLSDALHAYVRRAKRGADDAALLAGTSKDLLEATAAHILVERNGTYPPGANFEGLLGMAFVAMGLATPQHAVQPGEPPQRKASVARKEPSVFRDWLPSENGSISQKFCCRWHVFFHGKSARPTIHCVDRSRRCVSQNHARR